MFKKDEVIEKVKISNAKEKYVEVVSKEDVVYVKDKSKEEKVTYQMNYTDLVPPLKKGETIGYLLLMRDGVNIASFEVTSLKDIKALSLGEKVYQYFIQFIS